MDSLTIVYPHLKPFDESRCCRSPPVQETGSSEECFPLALPTTRFSSALQAALTFACCRSSRGSTGGAVLGYPQPGPRFCSGSARGPPAGTPQRCPAQPGRRGPVRCRSSCRGHGRGCPLGWLRSAPQTPARCALVSAVSQISRRPHASVGDLAVTIGRTRSPLFVGWGQTLVAPAHGVRMTSVFGRARRLKEMSKRLF